MKTCRKGRICPKVWWKTNPKRVAIRTRVRIGRFDWSKLKWLRKLTTLVRVVLLFRLLLLRFAFDHQINGRGVHLIRLATDRMQSDRWIIHLQSLSWLIALPRQTGEKEKINWSIEIVNWKRFETRMALSFAPLLRIALYNPRVCWKEKKLWSLLLNTSRNRSLHKLNQFF